MTTYCDARREMAALLTYARIERLAVAESLGGAA